MYGWEIWVLYATSSGLLELYVDVSSASIGRLQSHRFSSTNERTIQADLCCAGAPGCPTGSTTGAPETHCSAMWFMALAGYPPPLSDRQDRPGKATGQRTDETNEFRYKPPPEEGKAKYEGQNRGPRGRQKIPVLSHLSEHCFFLATQPTSTNNEGTPN